MKKVEMLFKDGHSEYCIEDLVDAACEYDPDIDKYVVDYQDKVFGFFHNMWMEL